MWSFEFIADITFIFSLSCNITKTGNNNMMLTLDNICVSIKMSISSFG